MTLLTALMLLPGLIVGLTLHEFAHALSASLLGDDFPRRQRRVSLNPLRHLSLLGTLAIFLLPFGWAKPVQINLYNFRRPKRDYFLSSIAGPAANLVVIAACLGLMQLTRRSYLFGPGFEPFLSLAHVFLMLVALINGILATLNLLPIPPLDGSKIWPVLIPSLKPGFGAKWSRLGFIVLIVLLWTDAIDPVFSFAIGGMQKALPAPDSERFDELVASADAAFRQKRYDRAVKDYTAALAINRWSADTHVARAWAHWNREDWSAALDDLNAAFALRPATHEELEFRAQVLAKLGRPAEAAADVRAAAELRRRLGIQPANGPSNPASAPAPATGATVR